MPEKLKNQIPNIITFFRAFFSPAIIFIELSNSDILQFFVLLLLILSDHMDGYIARKWKINSKLGEILEDLADFIFTFSLLATVNLRYNLLDWSWFAAIYLSVLVFTFLLEKIYLPAYKTLRSLYRATYPILFTLVLLDYSFSLGRLPVIIVFSFTMFSIIWKRDKIVEYLSKLFHADFR